MNIRPPYASGVFYLGYMEGLKREVAKCLGQETIDVEQMKNAIGVIVPHAGYDYSGAVAGKVYRNIRMPKTFIIIGPNHSGFGSDIAVDTNHSWKTPLGTVDVDEPLAKSIIKKSHAAKEDYDAHRLEHSVEVQLPFLQHLTSGEMTFVPISVRGNLEAETAESVGLAIADAVRDEGRDVLIVASTDLTHYEPLPIAERSDQIAIDAMLTLEPLHMLEVVFEHDISMCGPGPVATMMYAVNDLGATQAELVSYRTSADFSMNDKNVIGYAGIVIT